MLILNLRFNALFLCAVDRHGLLIKLLLERFSFLIQWVMHLLSDLMFVYIVCCRLHCYL